MNRRRDFLASTAVAPLLAAMAPVALAGAASLAGSPAVALKIRGAVA
jgi:hypothetical protein